jgi:hypothetical protein
MFLRASDLYPPEKVDSDPKRARSALRNVVPDDCAPIDTRPCVERNSLGGAHTRRRFRQGRVRGRRDLGSTQSCYGLNEEPKCRRCPPLVAKMACATGRFGRGDVAHLTCPSTGRVSIEFMDPKPRSNKRSDGRTQCNMFPSSAVSVSVARGASEPAFLLDVVTNDVMSGRSGRPL